MTISVQSMAVDTFVPMLRAVSGVLDKGAQQARANKRDADALVDAKLAPDMFPLSLQVQIACNHAKDCTAQQTGETPPQFENNEKTLDALKARIAKTLVYVESARPAAFEGAEDRRIAFDIPNADMAFEMSGLEFLRDWTLPHFYFHVVTAYDILRHEGIELGKRDYLAGVGRYIRPKKRG